MNSERNVLEAGKDIRVVIVTYNSADCIRECVASVLRQAEVAPEIVIVDNASSDGTSQALADLGKDVRVIANRENVGFGRACNQGCAAMGGRWLFLLNPDARFEEPDGLARLRRAMEQNPRWGLAGPRLLKADGCVESQGETRYPQQDRVGCDFSGLPGTMAWVSGASMIIRREAFEAVGGFDPGFFVSSEETDLCLRVRQHGWEIGFMPEVSVRHIGMASEQGVDPYETWRKRMPGLIRFWCKHYPAKDAERLVRRDWLRASLRREWYRFMSRFAGKGSTSWLKHRRYAGISEASREFLEKA